MRIVVHKENCTGCMSCVTECSMSHFGVDDPKKAALKIIKEGDDYIPVVCDQCGDCAEACPTDAIEKTDEGVYLVREDECILCTMCVGACPRGLLHETNDLDAMFKCDLCLKCVEACPGEALVAEED